MKRRGVNRSESVDFRSFPPSTPVLESNPLDPPGWDFQSHGYHRWPDAAHAHLMLPTVFYRAEDHMGIHLATSRDGVSWHRPQGQQAWLTTDDVPGGADYAWVHSCHGILPTAPGEWSIYVRPYHHGHNENKKFRQPSGLMRAVLREDGFVSLHSRSHGEFRTVPFVLSSNSLALNVKCGYAGNVRIGVERVPGDYDNMGSVESEAIDGFGLKDCSPVSGDHISAELAWRGGALSQLKGQTIRLHIRTYRADLFALHF